MLSIVSRGPRMFVARITGVLALSPKFTQTAVTTPPIHYGEICTNGLVCGSSDRTLLDFMSIAVDCNGYAHMAFAGNTKAEEAADFDKGAANIHEVNQVGGGALSPPSACAG